MKSIMLPIVLIIKPSIKGIKKLKSTISKVIVMNKPIRKIISELNPVLRRNIKESPYLYRLITEFIERCLNEHTDTKDH